jgi:UDP-3-O-[3-hydroxymyristoyl] N-acetylglucosamine deacetylase/3-hydroxyacyl-[acyl-carrier-protein] dehydratase
VVKEVISLLMRKVGSEILIMPNDHYCVTTMGFWDKILGTQNANMKRISILKRNI